MKMSVYLQRKCDHQGCNNLNDGSFMVLHGCGHSYHLRCITAKMTCPTCSTMLHTSLNDLVAKTNSAIFNPKNQSDMDSHPCQEGAECTNDDEGDADLADINLSEEKDLDNIISSFNKKILSLAIPLEPGTLESPNLY